MNKPHEQRRQLARSCLGVCLVSFPVAVALLTTLFGFWSAMVLGLLALKSFEHILCMTQSLTKYLREVRLISVRSKPADTILEMRVQYGEFTKCIASIAFGQSPRLACIFAFVLDLPVNLFFRSATLSVLGFLGVALGCPGSMWIGPALFFCLWSSIMMAAMHCYAYGADAAYLIFFGVRFGQLSPAQRRFSPKESGRTFLVYFIAMFMIMVLSYAACYSSMGAFEKCSGWSAIVTPIYFSATTQCTVGYGDIVPRTWELRWIATTHMIASFSGFVVLLASWGLMRAFDLETEPRR